MIWAWVAGAAAVIFVGSALFSSSSGADEDGGPDADEDDGGFGVGGKLPISGEETSICPNVNLPPPSGLGTGFDALPDDIDESIGESFRSIYEGPMKVVRGDFGDGEMGVAMMEMNAEMTHNLAVQAECAGYLDVARALYAKAEEIAGWASAA